jgi:chaperone required for assembly of F1-ATPase
MRDELTNPASAPASLAIDPVALGRKSLATPLRKRFYQIAEAAPHDDSFAILLDGRPVLTPAKSKLCLPSLAAAQAVAAEWQGQGEAIDPTGMPLTRILNAALDGVAGVMPAVAAEIVKYAGTDLVCYRAGSPESLVKLQAEIWDPVLAFAETDMGARFICVEGVMHVAQPQAALAAVAAKIDRVTGIGRGAPIALACLDVMTTLTGSALIALARVSGALSLEQAWRAAHVDEDFQIRQWGEDQEAMARRAQRFAEMAAADHLWQLVRI